MSARTPRKRGVSLAFADSHLHLSDYGDPRQALSFASSSAMLLVSAGVGKASSARTVSLSKGSQELIRAFVGVHPSEAEKEPTTEWLAALLGEATGVGEVGLDPKYSSVRSGSAQMRLFHEQLALAEKAGKPVEVHSRGAEKDCLAALETYRLRAVLLHWFQGEELASTAGQRGYYVSFGPALLASKRLQRMAMAWGGDRVLVESDGPVGFAHCAGAGGPWLVPSVLFRLARITGRPFEDTADSVLDNSLAFLGEKA